MLGLRGGDEASEIANAGVGKRWAQVTPSTLLVGRVGAREARKASTLGITFLTWALKVDAFALSYGNIHIARNSNI